MTNTEKTLSTASTDIHHITAACTNVIKTDWQSGIVAGVYNSCFNILTDERYLITVFKSTDKFSTRAMISDVCSDMNIFSAANGTRVCYKEGAIIVGGHIFLINSPKIIPVYRDTINQSENVEKNMNYFEFLMTLNAKKSPFFEDGFFKSKAQKGFNTLKKDIIKGLDMLLGLGIGLTPSCDDIIGGMAAYFHLSGKGDVFNCKLKQFLAEKGEYVTTCVSKNLLEDVSCGYINQTLYNLIYAIMCKSDDIEKHTIEMINYGSTSGTETCLGILNAYKLISGKENVNWL